MFQEVGGLHGDSERGGLIFSSDVTVNTEALKLVSKKTKHFTSKHCIGA